jgi:hypothetical protein
VTAHRAESEGVMGMFWGSGKLEFWISPAGYPDPTSVMTAYWLERDLGRQLHRVN